MQRTDPTIPEGQRPQSGVRLLAWCCVLVGLVGMVAAYAGALSAAGASWPAKVMAFAMPTATLGVTLLGVGHRPRRWVVWTLCAVHGLMAWAFVRALPTSGHAASTASLGGLPLSTVLVFVAAGALPLVLLPVVYFATFSRDTLSAEVIERVRRGGQSS